jgi:hypothetical protein
MTTRLVKLEGYDEWLRHAKDAQDVEILVLWARETLPCPVVPCGCTQMDCLRCQVERVIGERQALTTKPARPAGQPPF